VAPSFWRGEPFGLMPGGFPARPLRLIANVPHVFMGDFLTEQLGVTFLWTNSTVAGAG